MQTDKTSNSFSQSQICQLFIFPHQQGMHVFTQIMHNCHVNLKLNADTFIDILKRY